VTKTPNIPAPPPGTGSTGRRLWRAVLTEFELAEHELALLTRACRVADTCAALQAVVDEEGPMTTTRFGESKPHPALVELRAQSLLLARLVVALRVPLGAEEEAPRGRGQRRAVRGVYALHGGAS
jgi:hypothetical protein